MINGQDIAEAEAADLRVELKRAYESVIAIKRVSLQKCEVGLKFHERLRLFKQLTQEEVDAERQMIETLRGVLERDIRHFRKRFGCDPE